MKKACDVHYQYREGCVRCQRANGEDELGTKDEYNDSFAAGIPEAIILDAFVEAATAEATASSTADVPDASGFSGFDGGDTGGGGADSSF